MPFALDPDAQEYLLLRREQSAMSSEAPLSPSALREEERSLRARYGHGPEMHAESESPAGGGLPRHFLLDPIPEPLGTLVYLHGGGWVTGEPEDYLAVCRALASASGWRIVVADYRKAPESPFPAAFDDAFALVADALQRESRTRSGHGPVAVGGDSAGGNLAAAVGTALSEGNRGALAAQVLVTPVLDADFDTASYLDPARQLSLTRETMRWFWECYAPARDSGDARLSPLRGEHFEDLPPTIFVSVRSDVLWSEGERYRSRLREAGVTLKHREYPGQMHGFFQLYNVMAASQDAVSWVAGELNEIVAAESYPRLREEQPE